MSTYFQLQVVRKFSEETRCGLVLKYLAQNRYDKNDEVIRLLEARFYPLAIKEAEGKLSPSIARECIGTLKGYIYAIEQLAGIESSSTEDTPATDVDETDDPQTKAHLNDVQARIDFTEQMFGISNKSTENSTAA